MGYIIIFINYLVLGLFAIVGRVQRRVVEFAKGAKNIRGFILWDKLLYHDGHTWVKPIKNGKVKIGLDDFAIKLLGDIDHIALPKPGENVKSGMPLIKMLCGDYKTKALCPIDGEVVKSNTNLTYDASTLCRDPYGKGWLFTVKVNNGNLKKLYKGITASEWLLHEADKLHHLVSAELGLTVTDGGSIARNLNRTLNKNQWEKLVKSFLKT